MTDVEATQIESDLTGIHPDTYGEDHQAHTLEIYKLYFSTTENASDRRQKANSFFLTINTAVIALSGYIPTIIGENAGIQVYLLIPLAG